MLRFALSFRPNSSAPPHIAQFIAISMQFAASKHSVYIFMQLNNPNQSQFVLHTHCAYASLHQMQQQLLLGRPTTEFTRRRMQCIVYAYVCLCVCAPQFPDYTFGLRIRSIKRITITCAAAERMSYKINHNYN